MTVALPLPVRFVDCLPLRRVVLADGRSVRTLGNSRVDTRLLYAPCYDFLHLAVLKQRRADVRAAVSSRLPWRRGRPPRTAELTVGCRAALVTPFSIWRVLTGGLSMRSSCAPSMSSAYRLAVDAIDDERQRSSFRFCLASTPILKMTVPSRWKTPGHRDRGRFPGDRRYCPK